MPSVVCNIYDPVTHQLVFSKDDFTFLALADFDTGTTAGSLGVQMPAGATPVIQQSVPAGKTDASTVTISGSGSARTVNWTAGASSTHVRVMIR